MRVEKGYLHWKADLIDEYNPRAETGTNLEIGILGDHYPARVVNPVQYDPGNLRARG